MPAVEAPPIDEDEAGRLFDHLSAVPSLALGVSGGADSLALMVLIARWRDRLSHGPDVLVLSVDHGLRPSSSAEAQMVAGEAARLGLAHRTLRWNGPKPTARIEEMARAARYRLLAQACAEAGIADIAVAHHRDDQAETVLMRLGKGSGLAGLAGMRTQRTLDNGVRLHRPLLGIPKSRLAATTQIAGLVPVIDASNADDRFARPKLRALAIALAEAGVSPGGINISAARLAEADAAIEHYVDRLSEKAVSFDPFAVARIHSAGLADAPREVRLRLLRRTIDAVGSGIWPPVRHDRLEALEAAIGRGDARRTLGGAVIIAAGDEVLIHREPGRNPPLSFSLANRAEGVWDRRFAFRLDGNGQHFTLGPLGEDGRRVLGLRSQLAPRAALAALPALRRGGDIVSVPSVGVHLTEAAFTVKCVVATGRRGQHGAEVGQWPE